MVNIWNFLHSVDGWWKILKACIFHPLAEPLRIGEGCNCENKIHSCHHEAPRFISMHTHFAALNLLNVNYKKNNNNSVINIQLCCKKGQIGYKNLILHKPIFHLLEVWGINSCLCRHNYIKVFLSQCVRGAFEEIIPIVRN